jgi:endonuclease-3
MNKKRASQIFEIFRNLDPSPKTELEYTNAYTLLVAIVLSAQATDISVNKATAPLFKIVDTPEKMLELGEEGLKKYIKTIGLYNSKAKNVILLSQMLIEVYKNVIPRTVDELQKLPGVGRKTANVFLNCFYGEHTIGVDTHVFRVSNRIGLTKAKNVLETEAQLQKIIPKEFKQHCHHWLILHGRYICKARKPECDKCEITEFCDYFQEMEQ